VDPLPIACTLSGTDRGDRARWVAALLGRASTVTPSDDGVLVRFAADAALADELRAFAVAEAECCPFLAIAVTRDRDELALSIAGPPDARPAIDALLAGDGV
jgi:hypothetical protein